MLFHIPGGHMHPVATPREEVDRRNCVQGKRIGRDAGRDLFPAFLEKDVDIDIFALRPLQRRCKALQLDEQEPLWHGKIFLQQPVTVERPARCRQQCLFTFKPLGHKAAATQKFRPVVAAVSRPARQANGFGAQQLVKLPSVTSVGVDEHGQVIQRQIADRFAIGAVQPQPDTRTRLCLSGDASGHQPAAPVDIFHL